MTKLYVINDTPLFGVSRKNRRAALRREQSGENRHRPDGEEEGLTGPPPLPPREVLENSVVEAILPSTTMPRNATAETRSVWGMPAAYLLGPLLVARWTRGNTRMLWTTIGAVSLAAAAILAVRWTPFLGWAADTEHGSVAWLATLTTVCLAVFATWSRAIAAAAERHPAPPRHRFRNARLAFALGLSVPGLGHYLARRPRTAALAFRMLGPLTAATIVLVNGPWLWALHRAESPGAMGPVALEVVFATAAATAATLLGAWIAQAAHAARLATDAPHGARRGSMLAASVVAMALCVTLAAREPIAAVLHDTSTRLHAKQLRLIPLALCDAAARLDGSRPVYLVDTVSLNEELGRSAAARNVRATLRERAAEFESASRAAAIPVVLSGSAGGTTTAWARLQPLTAP